MVIVYRTSDFISREYKSRLFSFIFGREENKNGHYRFITPFMEPPVMILPISL